MVENERVGRRLDQAWEERESKQWEEIFLGVRNRGDPMYWRGMVVGMRKLLGASDPEWLPANEDKYERAKVMVAELVRGTHMKHLTEEILLALGYERKVKIEGNEPLDVLMVSGRIGVEPVLFDMADELELRGERVGVLQPVGVYSDQQPRVVMANMLREVGKMVMVASTQVQRGGRVDVLNTVLRVMRNRDLAAKVGSLDILIPMFGGSRGDKEAQDQLVGWEALELKSNTQQITAMMQRIMSGLEEKNSGGKMPWVRFATVDVHNPEAVAAEFAEEGFELINILPGRELARAVWRNLQEKDLDGLPVRVVICDEGAIPRGEYFAGCLLEAMLVSRASVDVVYLDKTRITAGLVEEARILRVATWRVENGELVCEERGAEDVFEEECVVVETDDMLDGGTTAKTDTRLVRKVHRKVRWLVFVGTHPVSSKGVGVLDGLGIDQFVFGNTLNVSGLKEKKNVEIVDVSPAVIRALGLD